MSRQKKIFASIEKIAGFSKKEAEVIYKKVQKIIQKNYNKRNPLVLSSLCNQTINNGVDKLMTIGGKGFDLIFKETQKELVKKYKIKLTDKEIKSISQQKSVLMENIVVRSSQLKTAVKALLLQNMGRGISFNQMVNGLQEMYPEYSSHIYTIANTSLQHQYKDIHWSKASEKFDYFVYSGPNDSVTREYCAAHVDKVYTLEQINAEGIEGEIMSFYNCRHTLEPITREEFIELGGVE